MTRPNITPAPWETYGPDSSDVKPVNRNMGDNGIVAQCPGYAGQRKANARAIAALPDLLDALESALPVITDQAAKHPAPEWDNIQREIKAALLKAGYTL